jgi:hypothetical protein
MKTQLLAVAALLITVGCGDSTPTSFTPAPPPPDVAGTYSAGSFWLVQFARAHDGYSGSWYCTGSLTLTQAPGANALTGFAVVGAPCPAISFPLTGNVDAGGGITLTMSGPEPGAGTCPAPPATTQYSGTLAGSGRLSMRGSANVNCPGEGEGIYRFDIIVNGTKSSYY